MNGGHYVGSKSGFYKLSTLFGYAKFWAEQCLSCGGAENHNYLWLNKCDLGLEPGTASRNFLSVRFFVDAAFATRLPLEMFDNISDVSLRAVDAGFFQGVIEQATGGTNEWMASEIFFIAGLFADEHDHRAAAPFAEDGLRASFPEVAGFAIGGGLAQRRQGYFVRKK